MESYVQIGIAVLRDSVTGKPLKPSIPLYAKSKTEIQSSGVFKSEEKMLNDVVKDVAEFYGLNSKVEITWNDSLKGDGKSKEEILSEYVQGVMPIDEAIKRLHPELSQDEVDEWVRKLEAKNEMADIFDTSKGLI